MSSPKPGIYERVDMAEYESWPAARHSLLRLFAKSAAHAREQMIHPPEPTKALEMGQAIHCAVLEPARWSEEYVAAPKIDRRTKIGKADWTAFESENQGKEVLDEESYLLCEAICDSVWAHPIAKRLLSGPGANEIGVSWIDPELDIPCKSRLDRITKFAGWTCAVDLKTTRDASVGAFARAVATYGYHTQAAFYLDGLDKIAPLPRRFVFIAVEKEPPYAVACYELEPDAILQGRAEYRRWLAAYKRAVESDEWPGYPAEIQTLALPKWAQQIQTEEW